MMRSRSKGAGRPAASWISSSDHQSQPSNLADVRMALRETLEPGSQLIAADNGIGAVSRLDQP